MKKLVALVAAGMFAASFAAQAGEGSCYGSTHTASTPVPTTTALDTATKPADTTKTGG